MNPPCIGDVTTCGKNYNRTTDCYQVPVGFKFGSNWTADAGVKSVSMSFCPDISTTPTYDSVSGDKVSRGNDGTVVLSTTCAPCNFTTAVQPWVVNNCPCSGAGDYCNITSGTSGVCHVDASTPCNSTQCPIVASRSMSNRNYISNNQKKARAEKFRADTAIKTAITSARKAYRYAFESSMRDNATCNDITCQQSCDPNKGSCGEQGCKCIGPKGPSYALPSYVSNNWY